MHHGQSDYLERMEKAEKHNSDNKLSEQEEKWCRCDVQDPFIDHDHRKCSDKIESDGGNDICPIGRRHAEMRVVRPVR
jgi:hypothetical protein